MGPPKLSRCANRKRKAEKSKANIASAVLLKRWVEASETDLSNSALDPVVNESSESVSSLTEENEIDMTNAGENSTNDAPEVEMHHVIQKTTEAVAQKSASEVIN